MLLKPYWDKGAIGINYSFKKNFLYMMANKTKNIKIASISILFWTKTSVKQDVNNSLADKMSKRG